MKVYNVKVNGKTYVVELEAVEENSKHIAATPAPQAAAPVSAGDKEIKAPMAGSIISVKVAVGDTVKVGDTVCVLEAMKLENDIKSTVAGTVKAINISKGSAVKNGDVMIIVG